MDTLFQLEVMNHENVKTHALNENFFGFKMYYEQTHLNTISSTQRVCTSERKNESN